MRTQVEKLTPEALISAPRRGPPVPNSNGTLALYTQSTHKIGDKTLQEVRVMDIHTASSKQLSDNDKVQDANWIPGSKDQVLYLKSGEKGRTEVVVANGADVSEEHYVAAEIDAPVSALKLKALEDGSVAFVVVGQVGNDGSLHNEQAVENKSSGRVFDTSRVRFVSLSIINLVQHEHALTYCFIYSGTGCTKPRDTLCGITSWSLTTGGGSWPET